MPFRDLKLRVRALFTPGRVERELDDELAFHIECETRKLMADGSSAAEARHRALARFGAVPLAADQCRDERGISFFETLARDVSFALRTFRRTPLVALTVVSTIALGLGVVTVAFTFFNMFFFRVDAVRNPDELFAVERPTRPGFRGHVPFTWTEYEAIRGNILRLPRWLHRGRSRWAVASQSKPRPATRHSVSVTNSSHRITSSCSASTGSEDGSSLRRSAAPPRVWS